MKSFFFRTLFNIDKGKAISGHLYNFVKTHKSNCDLLYREILIQLKSMQSNLKY